MLYFSKLFNEISKRISYLDIFKFLQTYSDSEGSESKPHPKIYNIRTKFNFKPKNPIFKKQSGTDTWMDAHV